MHNIDFLPEQYRDRRVRQRSQPWRFVIVAALGTLTGIAAMVQYHGNHQLRTDLETISPQFEQATAESKALAKAQVELDAAQRKAELITYLRHPWPRTQLLAALTAALPREVTLEKVQVASQNPTHRSSSSLVRTRRPAANQEDNQGLPPAVRDLKRLREKIDSKNVVVLVTGVTTNSAAIHRYLTALDDSSLFAKAELESSETVQKDRQPVEQFEAKLWVRPGYGQPGGPTDQASSTALPPAGASPESVASAGPPAMKQGGAR